MLQDSNPHQLQIGSGVNIKHFSFILTEKKIRGGSDSMIGVILRKIVWNCQFLNFKECVKHFSIIRILTIYDFFYFIKFTSMYIVINRTISFNHNALAWTVNEISTQATTRTNFMTMEKSCPSKPYTATCLTIKHFLVFVALVYWCLYSVFAYFIKGRQYVTQSIRVAN